MAKKEKDERAKTPCPICSGKITLENGFYICEKHGIMPYDWAIGEMSKEKALDQLAGWGTIAKRPKREKVVRTPDDETSTSAPVKGDVTSLLNQLKLAMNPVDKRKLRAALRKAGHTGGLKS